MRGLACDPLQGGRRSRGKAAGNAARCRGCADRRKRRSTAFQVRKISAAPRIPETGQREFRASCSLNFGSTVSPQSRGYTTEEPRSVPGGRLPSSPGQDGGADSCERDRRVPRWRDPAAELGARRRLAGLGFDRILVPIPERDDRAAPSLGVLVATAPQPLVANFLPSALGPATEARAAFPAIEGGVNHTPACSTRPSWRTRAVSSAPR